MTISSARAARATVLFLVIVAAGAEATPAPPSTNVTWTPADCASGTLVPSGRYVEVHLEGIAAPHVQRASFYWAAIHVSDAPSPPATGNAATLIVALYEGRNQPHVAPLRAVGVDGAVSIGVRGGELPATDSGRSIFAQTVDALCPQARPCVPPTTGSPDDVCVVRCAGIGAAGRWIARRGDQAYDLRAFSTDATAPSKLCTGAQSVTMQVARPHQSLERMTLSITVTNPSIAALTDAEFVTQSSTAEASIIAGGAVGDTPTTGFTRDHLKYLRDLGALRGVAKKLAEADSMCGAGARETISSASNLHWPERYFQTQSTDPFLRNSVCPAVKTTMSRELTLAEPVTGTVLASIEGECISGNYSEPSSRWDVAVLSTKIVPATDCDPPLPMVVPRAIGLNRSGGTLANDADRLRLAAALGVAGVAPTDVGQIIGQLCPSPPTMPARGFSGVRWSDPSANQDPLVANVNIDDAAAPSAPDTVRALGVREHLRSTELMTTFDVGQGSAQFKLCGYGLSPNATQAATTAYARFTKPRCATGWSCGTFPETCRWMNDVGRAAMRELLTAMNVVIAQNLLALDPSVRQAAPCATARQRSCALATALANGPRSSPDPVDPDLIRKLDDSLATCSASLATAAAGPPVDAGPP